MARGDKGTYNQQEQQAFGQAQQAARQGYQQQQQAFAPAYQGYINEDQNPGYTAGEQQAMRQATAGSLAGAFGAARTRLLDHQARTGNTAGVNATEEELARQQGQQDAQAQGALEKEFGQARISGQEDAARGLAGLYGAATSAANSGMGNSTGLVAQQGAMARQPGFWSRMVGGGLLGVGRG